MEKINKEIAKQHQRISNARTLMLDGEIDATEFKSMRIQIEEKITQLTCELNNVSAGVHNIGSKLAEATDIISNLGKAYLRSETAIKRQIVSSIFPSGLVFGEKKVRTLELNKVLSRILSIDKAFGGPKKRKHTNFGVLSLGVDPKRFELSVSSTGCWFQGILAMQNRTFSCIFEQNLTPKPYSTCPLFSEIF